MKRVFYASTLVMIIMALTCRASAFENPSTVNQNTGSIQGIVSDVSTGNPIAGASVSVAGNRSYDGENSPRFTETDSTGYYILDGVSAGSTEIYTEKDGYIFSNQGVQVVANDTIEADISLTPVPPPPPPPPPPAQGDISGTVTDASTGNPIAGASVSVTSNGANNYSYGWGWAKTSTDSNGNYLLTGISAGSTLVYAQAPGYLTGYQRIGVIANSTTIANLSLTAIVQPSKGTVQGTITDATTGLPITGAYVYASSSSQQSEDGDGPDCNNGGSQYAETDSTGFYTLSDLIAGNYNIIASANGYQSQTQPATVTGNNTTIVNFALQSQVTTSGSITGTVSDASTGNPIVGAFVFVSIGAQNWYGNLGYLKAQTDSTGTYEIDGVPSGNQVVKTSATGYEYSVQTVTIVANDTVIANFALNETPPPPVGTITGTVSDSSTGLPLAGVNVSIREDFDSRCFGPRDNVLFATTDANGNYSIYSVSTGSLYLIAIDSGYNVSKQQATVLDNQTTVVNFSLTAYCQGSTYTTVQVNENNPENTRIANIPMEHFIALVPVSDQVLPVSWKLLL